MWASPLQTVTATDLSGATSSVFGSLEVSKLNSNKADKNGKCLRQLRTLKPGYPVMHAELGMVRFVCITNDQEGVIVENDKQKVSCLLEEVRPLDDSDWEDKETATSFRKLLLGVSFTKSYKPLQVLRCVFNLASTTLLEFLIEWQETHGKTEWFYCTIATMSLNTFLPKRTLQRALRELTKSRIVGVRKESGKGRRNYYRIVWKNVADHVEAATKSWESSKLT